jgi:hypothetical protein
MGTVRALGYGMATKYRGSVSANRYKDRGMMSAHAFVERAASRDSKRLASEATGAFVALLGRTVPEEGATAYLERVDPRTGPLTLVRYSGKPSRRDERGAAVEGQWFLEVDEPGYGFPERVVSK